MVVADLGRTDREMMLPFRAKQEAFSPKAIRRAHPPNDDQVAKKRKGQWKHWYDLAFGLALYHFRTLGPVLYYNVEFE